MGKELTGSWMKHHDFLYFSGEDLGSKPVTLTIKRIEGDQVLDPNTLKKDSKEIIYFEETTKGIILNTGHHRALTALTGSPNYEDWKGKKVKWMGMPDKRHGLVCRLTIQYPNGKLKPRDQW